MINNRDRDFIRGKHSRYLGKDPAVIKFIDPDNLNFGIQPGSPAQNIGTPLSPNLPGLSDQVVGKPDIGPFEVGEVSTDWPRPFYDTLGCPPENQGIGHCREGGPSPVIPVTPVTPRAHAPHGLRFVQR